MAQKVNRKELLKDTDEFLSLSERAVNWVRDNKKWSYVIAGSFVFVLLVFIVGRAVYNSSQNTKRLAFQQAVNLAEKDSAAADQAIDRLNQFLKKYGGSELAPLARLSLASVYFDKGEFQRSVEEYQKAIKGLTGVKEFEPIAAIGLASAYQASGQGKQAIDTLTALESKPSNYLKEETLYQLARLYYVNGDKEKAKETGARFLKEFPGSSNAEFLKTLLGLAENQSGVSS